MNRVKKVTRVMAIVLLIVVLGNTIVEPEVVASEVPYDTYNYDYWDYLVDTPAAYYPGGTISGVTLGIKPFVNPQDICLDQKKRLYVADTGNNRVVVVENDLKTVYCQIDHFLDQEGVKQTFNTPSGVFVSENQELYICDTENKRVVVLKENEDTRQFDFVKYVRDPVSSVLAADFEFKPKKVAVDYANRLYVVAKNVFEGIMAFNERGEFIGYFGTINVSLNFWKKLWRRISTKEQRKRQSLYIPTEYTGVDIDAKGFVYASYIDKTGAQAAMRLNPKGEDVIQDAKGNGGDILSGFDQEGEYSGNSYMIDIVYRGKGIYSLLDSRRGRIFTYDHEGNLLYVFGGIGTQEGTFTVPTAIEDTGDVMLGLDSYLSQILIYSPSQYGTLIHEAIGLRYDGDEVQAVGKWHQVLKYNENFELANIGIGKAYLTAGDYKNALKYLKLGKSKKYYSIAFRRYRNEILRHYLGTVLTILVLVIIFSIILRYGHKKRLGLEED